jgi:hypothetical protein
MVFYFCNDEVIIVKKKLVVGTAALCALLCILNLAGCSSSEKSRLTRTITITGIPADITLFMASVDITGGGQPAAGAAAANGKLANGDSWTEIKNGRAVLTLYDQKETLTYIQGAQAGQTGLAKPSTKKEISGTGTVLVQAYKDKNPETPLIWGSITPLRFTTENIILKWADGKPKP